MNNERYNQIIDEVYKNYKLERNFQINQGIDILSQEEFINKCKTDVEFSERWGLKIEERELSEKERIILAGFNYENRGGIGWNMLKDAVDMDNSIPRKLITVTYQENKIEVYE